MANIGTREMNRIRNGWLGTVVMAFGLVTAMATAGEVRAIAELDLSRYAGSWHEVARLPAWFQRRCVRDTTASYALLDGGGIEVVNRCVTADGKTISAIGEARRAQRDGPASRLEVRFAPRWLSFLPLVWGDYWVLDLTPDYGAALIGTPDRKYLWILARTPSLDAAVYDRLIATARAQGFEVSRLIRAGADATR